LDVHDRLYKVVKFATLITDQVNQEQAVAEAAGIAYDISLQTDRSASAGAAVVQQTLDVMQRTVEKVQEAASGIEALDKQSRLCGGRRRGPPTGRTYQPGHRGNRRGGA